STVATHLFMRSLSSRLMPAAAPRRSAELLLRRRCCRAPPNCDPQPTFVGEGARPANLGQQALETPIVLGRLKQRTAFERLSRDERVGIRAHVLDVVFAKPALHLTNGVAVFLRVLILVAQPGLAPRRLGPSIAQDRIERDEAVTEQPCHPAPQ